MTTASAYGLIVLFLLTAFALDFAIHPPTSGEPMDAGQTRRPETGEGQRAARPTFIGFNPFEDEA